MEERKNDCKITCNLSITERLHPTEWSEFLGNPVAKSKVQVWCKKQKSRGLLVIDGASGVGKTSLATLALKDNRDPRIIDPSSTQTSLQHLMDLAKLSVSFRPLDGTPPVGILIDDIEGGGVKPPDVVTVVTTVPSCSIVVTCRDSDASEGLRKLTNMSKCNVTLSPVGRDDTQTLLRRMCNILNIGITHTQALHIHAVSKGDLRQAAILGDMEIRGGKDADVVTRESDAKLTTSQETDMAIACVLLGISNSYSSSGHRRQITGAHAIEMDPTRNLAMAHDIGLSTLVAQDRHRSVEALNSWADACDDISLGDVLIRRGGALESYELLGNAISCRSNKFWKGRSVRLNPRVVSKPCQSFTAMKGSSVNKKYITAIRPFVSSQFWHYPLRHIFESNENMLVHITESYELTETDVGVISKAMNLSKRAQEAAKKKAVGIKDVKTPLFIKKVNRGSKRQKPNSH